MASSKAKRPFRVVSKLETMAAKAPMKMAGLRSESSVLALAGFDVGNFPPKAVMGKADGKRAQRTHP